MTDEMVETFRKMCNYDPPEKDHEYYEIALQRYNDNVESTRETYYAFGTVGNATLCAIYPMQPGASETICHYIMDDYLFFIPVITGDGKLLSRMYSYLYQDGVFITLEHALEEGLITPEEAYDCMTANPDPYRRVRALKNEDSDCSRNSPFCTTLIKNSES